MNALGENRIGVLSDGGSIPLTSTITHRYEPEILIFRNVFVLTIKLPEA